MRYPNSRAGADRINLRLLHEDALRQIDDTQQVGGMMSHLGEPCLPKLLAAAEDLTAYFKCVLGNAEFLSRPSVAIVRSAQCVCERPSLATTFAMELASAGFIIVSSMARGIDPATHIGALEGTVSVLAGGNDNIYPRENNALYKDISDKGVIISEMPTGTTPQGRHFSTPQSNHFRSHQRRGRH